MKTYGYARVSTEAQVRSGLGLGAQEKQIKDYCTYKGFELTHIHVDPAESGGKPMQSRPAGRTLCEALVSGDQVVVAKLDRAWRDTMDCLLTVDRWRAQKVTLHLLDLGVDCSSAAGQLVLTVMAAMAEWERRRIGDRTREAMLQAKETRGARYGNSAYGFYRNGEFNSKELENLQIIRDGMSRGYTLPQITESLKGKFNRKGNPFALDYVCKLARKIRRSNSLQQILST